MGKMGKSIYKIVGSLDIETNNDPHNLNSFGVCYQLSLLNDFSTGLETLNKENIYDNINIYIERHYEDLFKKLDGVVTKGFVENIVPIILVHNLSFESVMLSNYFNNYEVKNVSKSSTNPVLITLLKNGVELLEFWDTANFSKTSLEGMGKECGLDKLMGSWDYTKFRTPNTELTEEEIEYARRDVVIPLLYISKFLSMYPSIKESDLGNKILTRTSVVRHVCEEVVIKDLKFPDGKRLRDHWMSKNCKQIPKDNDLLYLMHTASRGGMNYCSHNHASKVFYKTDSHNIFRYDANSMHPFHGCAHEVPVDYHKSDMFTLNNIIKSVLELTPLELINNYSNPFYGYFYAPMSFYNVRIKKNSVYERDGISSFSASRFHKGAYTEKRMSENEGGVEFTEKLKEYGYCDYASSDAKFVFSKLFSAGKVRMIMSEQSLWEFKEIYDFDYYEVEEGYSTTKTTSFMFKNILSFNYFYTLKTLVKKLRNKYLNGERIKSSEINNMIPKYIKQILLSGELTDYNINEIEFYYDRVKSDLNSLYGIEVMNEFKNNIYMDKEGFHIDNGLCGVDKKSRKVKSWYQYGSHISGWSRIHQLLFIYLLKDVVDAFICGDTDSHKIYTKLSREEIDNYLHPLHLACDESLEKVTQRTKELFYFNKMPEIGWYVFEGECDGIYAPWNKAYMIINNGKIKSTVAGLPTDMTAELIANGEIIDHSFNSIANIMYKECGDFEEVCLSLLNYNTIISENITGFIVKHTPEWGSINEDYNEPCAKTLIPTDKFIGNTSDEDNNINSKYAKINNPKVNTDLTYVEWPVEEDHYSIYNI